MALARWACETMMRRFAPQDLPQKGISTTTKDAVYAQYAHIPRCACGGYCHKPDLPGQTWLDGLYMGGPFLA